MTVAYIMDTQSGNSPQQLLDAYDTVCAAAGVSDALPTGALYHGVGTRTEGLRIVDVWESDAQFEEFIAGRIAPASQAAGLPQPEITRLEVARVRVPEGPVEAATFLQVVRLEGVDQAAFEEIDERVVPGGVAPDGCVFHVNGPCDGGWMVIDFWTTRAARDAFIEAYVAPTFRAARMEVPPIADLDLHKVLIPALTSAGSDR